MDAFEEVTKHRAAKELLSYFEEKFSQIAKLRPEQTHLEIIKQGFIKAEDYGYTEDEQKCKFALLAFVLGKDFDLEPNTQAILTEPLLHPDVRLTHLILSVEATAKNLANPRGAE